MAPNSCCRLPAVQIHCQVQVHGNKGSRPVQDAKAQSANHPANKRSSVLDKARQSCAGMRSWKGAGSLCSGRAASRTSHDPSHPWPPARRSSTIQASAWASAGAGCQSPCAAKWRKAWASAEYESPRARRKPGCCSRRRGTRTTKLATRPTWPRDDMTMPEAESVTRKVASRASRLTWPGRDKRAAPTPAESSMLRAAKLVHRRRQLQGWAGSRSARLREQAPAH